MPAIGATRRASLFVRVPLGRHPKSQPFSSDAEAGKTRFHFHRAFCRKKFYANIILNFSGVVAVDLPISVTANYHFPDGNITPVTDESEISISPNIALGASDKTFSFFSTLSDIVL